MPKDSKPRQQQMRARIAAAAARMMAEDGIENFAHAKRKAAAGRYSDIDLQLFTDDSKSMELFLLNRNIPYDIFDQRHFVGDQARAVSVLKLDWQGVPVNLAIHALKDERGTLKTTFGGRPIERAGIQAVAQLVFPQDG